MAQSAPQMEPDVPPRPSVETPVSRATESYDFRTGSELSREALSQLRLHSDRLATGLGRIINAYLDSPVRFEVQAVAGQAVEQFLGETPRHCAMGVVELQGALPQILWQLDQELIGPVVGRMLGGETEAIDRPATMLEAALLRRFIQEMIEVWATSWDRLARRDPKVVEVLAEAAQLRGKVRDGELVTIHLAAEIAGTPGGMRIAIPVSVAQRLVSDQAPVEEPRSLDAERVRTSGDRIVVPVSVILHRTQIPLARATKLKEGDIIQLGKPVGDPMTVCVRGRPKFRAQTGVSGGRLAARLLGPSGETTG